MIFVTVGTHEQAFDRLVKKVDKLVEKGIIKESVIVQTGYCTYEPKYCKWQKLFPYHEMEKIIKEARIIITHGGPASFIAPLKLGKIPIVVPRQVQYNEHVNDHQLAFAQEVQKRLGAILTVEDIEDLEQTILKYDELIKSTSGYSFSNNEKFNAQLDYIVKNMFI